MATKKKTTVNKNTVANKKSATTKRTIPVTDGNETKVVCPVCGAEFDILSPHEHTVKNATVIGADSGLGTIYLPVSKRGEALQAAGVDTSKYFSIPKADGTKQLMTYDADGVPVAVSKDDPIIQQILAGGTVPNKKLFRRWVMSQVFHGLIYDGYHGHGFAGWLACRGYVYQWEMFIKELHDQAVLYKNGDMENFRARNRWFDKALAISMAGDYLAQLRKDAFGRPQHKCKGVPYVTVDHKHYFLSDIEKKLITPMWGYVRAIEKAKTPQELSQAVRNFWSNAPVKLYNYKQCPEWKDAYRGMGGYAVMQNLLRFHGCTFPKDNDFYQRNRDDLDMLELAAKTYADGDGWRLFGLMKQCIDENDIDIEAKMRQWAAAKQRH